MKRILQRYFVFLFIAAVMLVSCHKEEGNHIDEAVSGGDSETGGIPAYVSQEYPSTAQVIYKAVTDVDGNCYDAVMIGEQVWMAQNLRTTRYADSTEIGLGVEHTFTEPCRYPPGYSQNYEQNEKNVAYYGYLYNWPAVMHISGTVDNPGSTANPSGVQGICPDGWHVPSQAEWDQMREYLNTQPLYLVNGVEHTFAKALSANWAWEGSNVSGTPGNDRNANNATGFSALPAGDRVYSIGDFGYAAHFWSATGDYRYDGLAYRQNLFTNREIVYVDDSYKYDAYSVRCVRN